MANPGARKIKKRTKEDAKAAILERILPVLAHQGRAARSRELAAAAGVSEGLLFKYFPTKEDLYAGVEAILVSRVEGAMEHALTGSDPADPRGVLHCLAFHILRGASDETHRHARRILARAVIEGDRFATTFLATSFGRAVPALCDLVAAAFPGGRFDLLRPSLADRLWSFHHACFGNALLSGHGFDPADSGGPGADENGAGDGARASLLVDGFLMVLERDLATAASAPSRVA